MMKILVSACLLGNRVRHNASDAECNDPHTCCQYFSSYGGHFEKVSSFYFRSHFTGGRISKLCSDFQEEKRGCTAFICHHTPAALDV
jgi:hypothetical protein